MAICLGGSLRNGDPKLIPQLSGDFVHRRLVPAADENRSQGANIRIQTRPDAPFDAAQISFRRSQILLPREKQSYIHRHTGINGFLDRGNAFGSTGNLDEEVGPPGPGVKPLDFNNCAWRVVSERRRNFKRNPTVDAIRPVVDRAEQVGSLPEVLDSKLEEEGLPGLALLHLLADGVIVEVRFLNGVIEDRWV